MSDAPATSRRLLPDLFHITEAEAWDRARESGFYDQSTRGSTRDEVGFIHASFAWQVESVANFLYEFNTEPVLLLRIDPRLLHSPVEVESDEEGAERFPHIYGPIPVDAVLEVLPLERSGERYVLPFSFP